MENKEKGYRYCINLAIKNAKDRMTTLDDLDQKSIQQEYKEWITDEFNYQSILLLRDDPII